MKLATLFAASLAFVPFAPTASADHASENAGSIAQLAYRLADTAEDLERHAFADAGGGFRNSTGTDVILHEGDGQEPADHRDECLGDLARVARRLHLAASDLYRQALWYGQPNDETEGGNSEIQDHQGDSIRSSYQRTRMEFENVRRTYATLSPYEIDQHIHYLVRNVMDSYSQLEWYVNGVRQ